MPEEMAVLEISCLVYGTYKNEHMEWCSSFT